MTQEDVLQELEREPFIPLRLHLSSGQKMDIEDPNSAFVRKNYPGDRASPCTRLGSHRQFDVIAYRMIERIETSEEGTKKSGRRRKAS